MRRLFFILSGLNLLDGVVTYIGYYFNLIREANPMMATLLYANENHFLLFKFGVSVYLACIGVLSSKLERFRWLRYGIKGVIFIYLVIMLFHLKWFFQFLYFRLIV